MRQAPDAMAGRPRTVDLKLGLALRVAALAAVCFIAVAAYALYDSDRIARAKASRIAEIVGRGISGRISVTCGRTGAICGAIAAARSSGGRPERSRGRAEAGRPVRLEVRLKPDTTYDGVVNSAL